MSKNDMFWELTLLDADIPAERLNSISVVDIDRDGKFEKVLEGKGLFIIDEGTGTHEALFVDTRNKGVLDILAKPLHETKSGMCMYGTTT